MNQFSFGYTETNLVACAVDGENIVQTDRMGNRTVIGKTMTAYSELESVAQEYYDKLVELGAIIPEKSAEELVKEMQASMLDMARLVRTLTDEVKELKKNGHDRSACRCGEDVPAGKSKRSGGKSATGDSGDG